jgi:hypothetical protein
MPLGAVSIRESTTKVARLDHARIFGCQIAGRQPPTPFGPVRNALRRDPICRSVLASLRCNGQSVRVTGGTMVSADRGDWIGRKDLRVVPFLGLTVAILITLTAVLATTRLVSDALHPERVCERQLPVAEGLAVSTVDRVWPPPLVRCDIVDRDLGQESFHDSVNGLTSTHLAVVVALDAIVFALAIVGLWLWRARRRA